jgi:hypothetical protein
MEQAHLQEIESIRITQNTYNSKMIEEFNKTLEEKMLEDNLKLESERIDHHNREIDKLTEKLAIRTMEVESEIEALLVEKQRKEAFFEKELTLAKETKLKNLLRELSSGII